MGAKNSTTRNVFEMIGKKIEWKSTGDAGDDTGEGGFYSNDVIRLWCTKKYGIIERDSIIRYYDEEGNLIYLGTLDADNNMRFGTLFYPNTNGAIRCVGHIPVDINEICSYMYLEKDTTSYYPSGNVMIESVHVTEQFGVPRGEVNRIKQYDESGRIIADLENQFVKSRRCVKLLISRKTSGVFYKYFGDGSYEIYDCTESDYDVLCNKFEGKFYKKKRPGRFREN